MYVPKWPKGRERQNFGRNEEVIPDKTIAKNYGRVEGRNNKGRIVPKNVRPQMVRPQMVYAFMLNSDISGQIVAWDGGTIFDYDEKELEAGGVNSPQHTWLKYVKKVMGYPLRTREGKRVLKDV